MSTIDCLCKTLVWIAVPIWLPLYLITIPPYQCCRNSWRKHIGPVHEYHVQRPVSKQRTPRRRLSMESLEKIGSATNETTDDRSLVRSTKNASSSTCGFWKLPFELRMMIWKELLLLEYNGSVEVCLFSNRPNKINLYSYDAVRNLDATVLRLSRRFYLEGMNILYEKNKFRMRSEATLSSLARRVAPSRLGQIRTLHFAVHHFIYKTGRHRRNLTLNTQVWNDACEDLKKFTGLSQLRITLKMDLGVLWTRCTADQEWSKRFFKRILGPLEDVKVKEGGEFTVGYTWLMGVCDEWPEGSFTMRYIDDPVFYWW